MRDLEKRISRLEHRAGINHRSCLTPFRLIDGSKYSKDSNPSELPPFSVTWEGKTYDETDEEKLRQMFPEDKFKLDFCTFCLTVDKKKQKKRRKSPDS